MKYIPYLVFGVIIQVFGIGFGFRGYIEKDTLVLILGILLILLGDGLFVLLGLRRAQDMAYKSVTAVAHRALHESIE